MQEQWTPEMQRVFNPDYWGSDIPDATSPCFRLASRASKQQAKQSLAPILDGVVNGAQEGTHVAAGTVFNPLDTDLDEVPHHYPGTVLLADTETLCLGEPNIKWTPTERDWNRSHLLDVSPRQLIRERSHYVDGSPVRVWPGLYIFGDVTGLYIRAATLMVIGRNRRGQSALQEMVIASMQRDEQSEALVAQPTVRSETIRPAFVRESQKYRNKKTGEISAFYRIKSLEVVAAGERVPAKAPNPVFSFLGRLTTNPSV